ncbi:MAG: hypothetical protein ABWX74_11180 [Aeromicrobium sp.]
MAQTTLARAIAQGDRLNRLTLELFERYEAELEDQIRTGDASAREDASRTLEALIYRSLTDLTFASAASWTVWALSATGATIKGNWSRHQPVVQRYLAEVGKTPPTDAVFVALNWGLAAGMPTDDWANFHGGSRDYFLADAIRGQVGGDGSDTTYAPLPRFRGVYITDFYKGLPTSDGGVLTSIAGDDVTELTRLSGDLLAQELRLLGATSETVLVPLGRSARDVVVPFCDRHGYATPRDESGGPLVVDHYSYVQRHASFYEKLARAHATLRPL